MDQAFINIRGKRNKRLRFDSIATDGVCCAERRRRLSVNRNATTIYNNNNLLVFPYRWCYLNAESLNKNSKKKRNKLQQQPERKNENS